MIDSTIFITFELINLYTHLYHLHHLLHLHHMRNLHHLHHLYHLSFRHSMMADPQLLPHRFKLEPELRGAAATRLTLTACANFVLIGYSNGHVNRYPD